MGSIPLSIFLHTSFPQKKRTPSPFLLCDCLAAVAAAKRNKHAAQLQHLLRFLACLPMSLSLLPSSEHFHTFATLCSTLFGCHNLTCFGGAGVGRAGAQRRATTPPGGTGRKGARARLDTNAAAKPFFAKKNLSLPPTGIPACRVLFIYRISKTTVGYVGCDGCLMDATRNC